MAQIILVADLLLSWYALYQRRAFRRWRGDDSLGAHFWGHVLEWTASLAIVLVFYDLVLLVLSSGWEWITARDLLRMESFFRAVQGKAEEYKPSWLWSFAVLIALYLFGRWWIRFWEKETPYRFIRRSKTAVHIVMTVLFLLSCFTLLGSEAGEAASTLEVRLRQERTDYGNLRREIHRSLAGAALQEAYQRSLSSPAGQAIGDLTAVSFDEGENLKAAYASARSRFSVQDSGIESLIRRLDARRASLDTVERQQPVGPTETPAGEIGPVLPNEVTYRGVVNARRSLESFKEKSRPGALRLLQRPGGRELVLSLPDGMLEHLSGLLDPISREFPVFAPIFDVLKATAGDLAESRLGPMLDRLAAKAVERPADVPDLLTSTAHDLMASSDIRPIPSKEWRRAANQLQKDLAEVRSETSRLKGLQPKAPTRAKAEAASEPKGVSSSSPAVGLRGVDGLGEFRRGLTSGWVVTENPDDPGKLFVHRALKGGMLVDLEYLVKESAGTWTVYEPSVGFGGATYGRRVGTMAKPSDVAIGLCTCR